MFEFSFQVPKFLRLLMITLLACILMSISVKKVENKKKEDKEDIIFNQFPNNFDDDNFNSDV